jgi:hypothetical protein
VVQEYETAQFLPAVRTRLTGDLICYGTLGRPSGMAEHGARQLRRHDQPVVGRALRDLEVGQADDRHGAAAYGKWLDQTSDRETVRRDRIHGASGIIPTPLWIVLFLTAGIGSPTCCSSPTAVSSSARRLMLMGSATTVVVVTLSAINALDHPYLSGVGSVAIFTRWIDAYARNETRLADFYR